MRQNYVFYFVATFIIYHGASAMEESWEQKAQDIKNLYNKASRLESEAKNTEALELYIQITEANFPKNDATKNFPEIFYLKQHALGKVEKLSKEKETAIAQEGKEEKKENENETSIWSILHFLTKLKFKK